MKKQQIYNCKATLRDLEKDMDAQAIFEKVNGFTPTLDQLICAINYANFSRQLDELQKELVTQ